MFSRYGQSQAEYIFRIQPPSPLLPMQSRSTYQEIVLFILRLMIAAIFLSAGYTKWSFWTAASEGMSGSMVNLMKFLSIIEPMGGLALIAGFLTRWAAAGLAIIMIGAIYSVQSTMQVSFTTVQGSGWEIPLTILGGCLVLMTFGAGRWSVETIYRKP